MLGDLNTLPYTGPTSSIRVSGEKAKFLSMASMKVSPVMMRL
jgi:hypothetical protein